MRRKLALLTAISVFLSSIPNTHLIGHAAEELIVESEYAQEMHDHSDHEAPVDELMLDDIVIEDVVVEDIEMDDIITEGLPPEIEQITEAERFETEVVTETVEESVTGTAESETEFETEWAIDTEMSETEFGEPFVETEETLYIESIEEYETEFVEFDITDEVETMPLSSYEEVGSAKLNFAQGNVFELWTMDYDIKNNVVYSVQYSDGLNSQKLYLNSWWETNVQIDGYENWISVYGSNTMNGESVYLALKKDESFIPMPYHNDREYNTGEYQLVAWIDGYEEETMITEDIIINGLDSADPTSLFADASYEVNYSGKTLVYELESEEDQLYRYKFESDQEGICSLFYVDDSDNIVKSKVYPIESGKAYSYSGVEGRSYYLAVKGTKNTEAYNAILTYENISISSVSLNFAKDNIFDIWTICEDLQKEVAYTIHYEEDGSDSETLNLYSRGYYSSDYNNNIWANYRVNSNNTRSNESVVLALKKDGSYLNMPYPYDNYIKYPTGAYQLVAYIEGYKEETMVTQDIFINGFEKMSTVDLTPETSCDISYAGQPLVYKLNTEKNQEYRYVFNTDNRGKYTFFSTRDEMIVNSWTNEVYGKYSSTFVAEEGCSYYLVVIGDESLSSYNATLTFEEVYYSSVSLNFSNDNVFDILTMKQDLQNELTYTVNYSDDGLDSETFIMYPWGNSYSEYINDKWEQFKAYNNYSRYNEHVVLALQKDGSYINMPYEKIGKYPSGTYQLIAYVDGQKEKTMVTQDIVINGLDQINELSLSPDSAYDVNYMGQTLVYKLETEKDQKYRYMFHGDENGECVLFSVKDDEITSSQANQIYPGTYYNFSTKEGYTYYLAIKGNNYVDYYNATLTFEKDKLKSVSLDLKNDNVFDIWTLEKDLLNEVTFTLYYDEHGGDFETLNAYSWGNNISDYYFDGFNYCNVLSNNTRYNERVDFALKKDGRFIPLVYSGNMKYPSGAYQLVAYVYGREEMTTVTQDIIINGLDQMNAVSLLPENSYNVNYYGQSLVYKLETEKDQIYRVKFESNEIGEFTFFSVNNDMIASSMNSQIYWNHNYSFKAEEGYSYYLAVKGENNAPYYYATLTFEEVCLPISISVDATSVDAGNLINSFRSLPVTVTYDNGEKRIVDNWYDGTWSWFENKEINHYYQDIDGYDHIEMLLYGIDSEGNRGELMDMPNRYGSLATIPVGQMYLRIVMRDSQWNEISIEVPFEIKGEPEQATAIDLGSTYTINGLAKGEAHWFTFTAPDSRRCTITFDTAKRVNMSFDIFEYTENGFIRTYYREYAASNIREYFNITAGKKYAFILKPYNKAISEDINFTISMNRKLSSIEFLQPEYYFSGSSIPYDMRKIELLAIYDDGSTKILKNWKVKYKNDGFMYLYKKGPEAEKIFIGLKSLPDENGVTEKLDVYNATVIREGDFTLYAYVNGYAATAEAPVTVEFIPTNAVKLSVGDTYDYKIDSQEAFWIELIPEEDKTYCVSVDSTIGSLECYLYEYADGMYDYVTDLNVIDQHKGNMTFTAKAGKRYGLRIYGDVAFSVISADGQITFTEKRDVVSAEILGANTYNALDIHNSIFDIPVELIYSDGSKEVLDIWDGTYYDSEGDEDYEAFRRTLYTSTSDNTKVFMRMYDAEGINQIHMPYYSGDLEDQDVYLGDCQLQVFVDRSDTPLAAKNISIDISDATELTENQVLSSYLKHETKTFAFTAETAGDYIFKDLNAEYDVLYKVYRYHADENKLESVYANIYSYAPASFTAEEGQRFYLTADQAFESRYRTAKFSIVKSSELESIVLLADTMPAEIAAGLDKLQLSQIYVELTYADGSSQKVRLGKEDSFGNYVSTNAYKVMEDGYIDWDNPYKTNSKLVSGTYYVTAEVYTEEETIGAGTYISVKPIIDMAVGQNFTDGQADVSTTDGYYTYLSFVPEVSGVYVFAADVFVDKLRVYNAEGAELPKSWKDEYSIRVELTEGETYAVAVRSDKVNSFSMSVEMEKSVQEVVLEEISTVLIAGLDTISKIGMKVVLTLTNGETITLNENNEFVDGNGFRYEVVNVNTGEKVDASTALTAGEYQITAVQRTGTAIYMTGSTVVSSHTPTRAEYRTGSAVYQTGQMYYQTVDYKTGSAVKYHTGSAVTRENVKSNSVTVQVQTITAEGLDVLKEEEAVSINAGSERQLYAFTPEKSAVYELEHQTDLTWNIYEIGDTGLIPAPKLLEAGKTYIVCLDNVWKTQTVIITADIMSAALDETNDVQVAAFDKINFVFTPEEDGLYEVSVASVSDLENAEIHINSQIGSAYAVGCASLKGDMISGTAYEFELLNMTSLEQSYQITVKNISERVPTELIVNLADNVYYRMYLSAYDYEDMFDVYVKYSDGTVEEKRIYEKDVYGYRTNVYWNNAAAYERHTVTYVYYITYGDLAVYKKVVFQRFAPEPLILTEGTEVTATVDAGGMSFFEFTPEKDGEYYLDIQGLMSYSIMEMEHSDMDYMYGPFFDLEANICYTFCIKALEDPAGTEMTVTVSEENEITGLKLLNAAESCYPAAGMYGEGMTAEVTYADGTTHTIKGSAPLEDGHYLDAYGNKICMTYKLISNDKVRVYLSCGSYRVYSDADIIKPSDMTVLNVNSLTELVTDNVGYGYTMLAAFTPEETGAYQLVFGGDYALTDVPYFMNPVTGKKDEIPSILTAGETYVLVLKVNTIENMAVTVRPIIAGSECSGEHIWNTTPTIDLAPTCTTVGSHSIHCSVCDVKDETTITEIPMLGHAWDEGEVTTEATCVTDKIITYTCENCNETKTEVIPSDVEHSYLEYTYDENATDDDSGTETAYCINGCGTSDTRNAKDLAEGICGSGLTWTLRRNGTMLISGNGSMGSYSSSTQPWTAYQDEIKKVVIESGVTYIGEYAFYRCTNLEEISIPDSVIAIGRYAFYNCDSLNNVVIPEGVTDINEYTFYGCKSMKNLTLPATLERIGRYAFAECVFGDLVVPEGVTSFEAYVFYMSYWDSLTLPSTLTTMGTYVFSNSGALKGIVTTPEGMTYLPQGTYCMCGNMTGIVIRDGVTSIDYNVFRYCNSLKEVWIPESVTYIDSRAFYGLTPSEITIYGYAGTEAETYAEKYGYNFVTLKTDGIVDKTVLQETVLNMESAGLKESDYSVTSWTAYTSMLTAAKTVIADDTATQKMIDKAVADLQTAYEALKKHVWDNGTITVPQTCSSAGTRIYTCTSCGAEYTEEIPADGISHKFENYAADGNATCTDNGTETAACLYECGTTDTRNASTGATGHLYDEGIITKQQTCINSGERTYTCIVCEDSYTETILADGIHQFGEYQYNNDATCTEDGTKTAECTYGCGTTDTKSEEGSALGHSFAEYVYDGNATDEYSGTETAVCVNGCGISDTRDVLDLAEGTCGSNLSWTLRRNGTLIISGEGSMSSYSSSTQPWAAYQKEIKKAVIESGVTYIGEYAFYRCTNLEEISIPDSVTGIGRYAFYYCSSLNNVVIPEGVTDINEFTFYGCTSMKNLTLPATLEIICRYAFAECVFGDLVVPEGVTRFEAYVFYMSYWDSLTLPSTLTTMENYVFSNSGALKGIVTTPEGMTYLPQGTYCMCGNMTGIIIRDGVTSIDYNVFRYCNSLTEVWIPESVTYIDSRAFYGLTPSKITIYGYAGTTAETYAEKYGYNFVTLKTDGIVDKTVLQKTVLNMESAGLRESDYSVTSWTAYTSMLTAAKTVIADDTATQKMIDKAVADLQTAYGALKKHVWDNGIITVPQTCSTAGTRIYTCTGCGAEYTEELPADEISHKFVNYTADGNATCTDNGTETAACLYDCGTTKTRNASSGATGHLYDEGTITEGQNCSYSGIRTYSCTLCDDNYTEMIPADGSTHKFAEYQYNNDATCTEDGTKTAECAYGCGITDTRTEEGSALGHTFAEYVYDDNATDEFSGTETSFCTNGCKTFDTRNASDLAEGTCGSALTWTLRRNGTLIISGEGSMGNYSSSAQPWSSYKNEIKKAVIEDGVTYIGAYAFYWCTKLEAVSIPDSVRGIGEFAFYYCSSLNNVVIPEGITSVERYTFYGCSSMRNLTLPSTLDTICSYAFAEAVFGDLVIPEGVTTIQGYAFYVARWDSLTLPSTLTTLGTYVFSNSGGVKGIVTTPEGITYLPQGTYCMCGNMTGIVIRDGVKSIDYNVFRYCNSLTEVWIPESVTYIDSRAFYGLTPSKITIYGYAGTEAETYAEKYGYNFVTMKTDGKVDKTVLQEAVLNMDATGLKESDYSVASWTTYVSMFTAAKAVLTDNTATQTRIDQAVADLQEAYDALKRHVWDDGKIKVEATCCTVGERIYTCTGCDAKYSEVIPADGISHQFVKYTANGDATCTDHGTETAVCSWGCGKKDTRNATSGKRDHIYNAGVITSEPNCSKTGELTYSCIVCNDFYTEEIDADGKTHSFVTYTSDANATCMSNGTETAKCENCNITDTREASTGKLEHCFTDYTYNEDATCFEDGTETAACEYECGSVDTRIVEGSKLSHSFVTYYSDGNATCLSNGTETAECKYGCGITHTRNASTGKPKGHIFKTYIPNHDETCVADGTMTAKCENCSATDTQVMKDTKTGHKYPDGWSVLTKETCTESGQSIQYCVYDCGMFRTNIVPETGHKYENQPLITEEATEQEDGKIYRLCANGCGKMYIEAVLVNTAAQNAMRDIDQELTDKGQIVGFIVADHMMDIDNQSLIDSVVVEDENGGQTGINGMELVKSIEEAVKMDVSDTRPNVGESTGVTVNDDGEPVENKSIQISGAAVTVAAAINQDTQNYYEDGQEYRAQLAIKEEPVMTASLYSRGRTITPVTPDVYMVDIYMNIVDKDNKVVDSDVSLAAPVEITIPVKDGVLTDDTKLYHFEEREDGSTTPVEIKFTNNGDGTVTFCTPSFSYYCFENEHRVVEWENTIEATCTQNGLQTGICTICMQTVTKDVPMFAHEYVENRTEATCSLPGEVYNECKTCGRREVIEILPATGAHTYNDKILIAATCTDGVRRFTCTTCTASYDEVIPGGHSFETAYTIDVAATCISAGSKSIHCENCNETMKPTTIEQKEHSWSEKPILTKVPTCTDVGEVTYTCTQIGCSATHTLTIAENGHFINSNYTVDKEATCTEPGEKSRHCKNCDYSTGKESIEAAGHKFTRITGLKKDATCKEAGWIEYQCENCRETYSVTLDKLDHVYGDFETSEPTCTVTGSRAKYCIYGCGESFGAETIPAKGHELDRVIDQEENCVTDGSQHMECRNCNYVGESTVIFASGIHEYASEMTVDKKATCTSEGSQSRHCKNCDAVTDVTSIPKEAHVWDGGVISKPSDCVNKGEKLFTCVNCKKETRTESVDALGHNYASSATIDKAPTCTSEGSQSRHCSRCDAVTDVTAIAKKAHEWDNGVVTVEPNCECEGEKLYTCLNCKTETFTEKESALGHDYASYLSIDKAATCTEEGVQSKHCSRCDAVTDVVAIAMLPHDYQNYVVTKAPTVVSKGVLTGKCFCGAEDSQPIDQLPGTIILTEKDISLQIKKSVKLDKLVTGLAEGDSIVEVRTSDKKIVSVSGTTKITGKKAGKSATITVVLASGTTADIKVKVQKNAVKTSGISGVSTKLKLKNGEQYTVTPVIKPVTTTDKLTFTTSNKKIVTVSKNGVITAKASGKAKITVKSGSKKKVITVTVEKIAPTEISGIPATKTLKKGKSFTLKAKLLPKNSEATISFKSSNNKVVTVNAKGKVTAKKKGTATITVKAGKVSAVCNVTVR